MAQQKAPLLWALLLTACLMNSGRAFVLHQPALMRTRSTYRVAGSSSLSGSCGTDRGACSISWEERGKRMRREHRMKMDTATGGIAEGSDSDGNEQTRSSTTKIFVEAPDDPHHPLGSSGAALSSAPSSSRSQSPAESGGGATNLQGIADGHVTDSGGIDGGEGGGGGGGGGGGDGGGKGDEGGEAEGDGGDELDIAAKGRRRRRIVRKVEKAVKRGRIPKESSKDYAKLLTSPLMSLLCKNSGWRARLLGDTTFMTKLAIEMVTGTGAQILAEYQKRGKKFTEELDFVFADTLTCLFANFAAVWLSCPTVAVKAVCKKEAAKAGGAMQKFLASCPSNAFQKVVAEGGVTKSFSIAQRGTALLLPMPKLFVIGFGATLAGYGLIAGLETFSAMRNQSKLAVAGGGGVEAKGGSSQVKKMSKKAMAAAAAAAPAEKPPVPVLGSGLAVGVFLAVWTNFRYQFIAGAVEQRVFDTVLAKNPGLSSLGSTAVRSANLYLGSLTIVDWLRFVGLQH